MWVGDLGKFWPRLPAHPGAVVCGFVGVCRGLALCCHLVWSLKGLCCAPPKICHIKMGFLEGMAVKFLPWRAHFGGPPP